MNKILILLIKKKNFKDNISLSYVVYFISTISPKWITYKRLDTIFDLSLIKLKY